VKGGWGYSLGSAVLVLIANQFITGIILTMIYIPSTTEGWEVLRWIQTHDAFASLVRGFHLWGCYVLLLMIGLHALRTFLSGSYKRPRELNWMSGATLLLLVLAMAITGAMLPWDQAAYWTAVVVTNILAYFPVIGDGLRELWRGGEFVGPVTLVRTYGMHIWLFSSVLLATITAHLYYLRRHGEFGSWVNYLGRYRVAGGVETKEPPPPEARPPEHPYPASPTDEMWATPLEVEDFYPHQTMRDAIVSGVCLAAVLVLALAVGVPLEAKATQGTVSYTPVPEWFYLPLDQLLVMVPSQLISMVLWVPLAGTVLLFLVPFLDRDPERIPWTRPRVLVPGLLIVAFIVSLEALGAARLFNL
jgi:quinol-cytochrome oxidoreductase complex cytochrome b subunit